MRTYAGHTAKHLTNDQIYDATRRCLICYGENLRKPVFVLQRDPEIVMLDCPSCGAASASHMPTPETLAACYKHYFDGESEKVTFKATNRRHLFRGIADRVTTRNHIRILDVGGGDGSLSFEICKELLGRDRIRSAEIVVVDYAAARNSNVKEIQIEHKDHVRDARGTFDLILVSAILEHIPDVFDTISTIKKLTTSGTVLYGRTPFALPLARVMPFLDLGYPYHVHDMGPNYWLQFARIYDLDAEVVSSGPSMVESDLFRDPLRTVAAHVLKTPCRVEMLFHRSPWWKFVGGWEAYLRFR